MNTVKTLTLCVAIILTFTLYAQSILLAADTAAPPLQLAPTQSLQTNASGNFAAPINVTVEVPNKAITYLDSSGYTIMGLVKPNGKAVIKSGTMFFKINGVLVKEDIKDMWGAVKGVVSTVPVNQSGVGRWEDVPLLVSGATAKYKTMAHAGNNVVEAFFTGTGQNNEHLTGKGSGILTVHKIPTKIHIFSFRPTDKNGKPEWMISGAVLAATDPVRYAASSAGTITTYINGKNSGTVPSCSKESYGYSSGFKIYYNWSAQTQSTVNFLLQYSGEELTQPGFSSTGQIKYYGPGKAPELYINGQQIYYHYQYD
ncbi:MAG: hypothetical protein LWW87_01080 [Geobacteraceae bacterium]|nr:hypothetical protein [Geobacteraceae bacterium]